MGMQGKNTANALCICEYFNEALPQKYTPKTAPDAKVIAYVHRRAQFEQNQRNTKSKKSFGGSEAFLH